MTRALRAGLMAAVMMMSGGVLIAQGARTESANLKLALDWYPNANHLGLFIAQEKGYFRQENLAVMLYTPVDPSTVLQTVGSGTDEFGISYQPDVLLARAQTNLPQEPERKVSPTTNSDPGMLFREARTKRAEGERVLINVGR